MIVLVRVWGSSATANCSVQRAPKGNILHKVFEADRPQLHRCMRGIDSGIDSGSVTHFGNEVKLSVHTALNMPRQRRRSRELACDITPSESAAHRERCIIA